MRFLEERRERLLKKLRLSQKQNRLYTLIVIAWVFFLIYYVYESVHIEYQSKENPIVSYFEESGDDLKYIYCALLQKAQKSITVSSFGLSDPDIIRILKEKKTAGLDIIDLNSSQEKKARSKASGLYHRKILIIDDKELYIGSANCTQASLCFHGNQIWGFYHPDLIEALKENKSYFDKTIDFYLLPENSKLALAHLLHLIQHAKDKIIVTMFSLTHPDIINELISAHNRGVLVKLYLDDGACRGTCKKYIEILKKNGLFIATRKKYGLLHHKAALVDNTYAFGSANFSKAGFGKNEETFVVIPITNPSTKKNLSRFLSQTQFTTL